MDHAEGREIETLHMFVLAVLRERPLASIEEIARALDLAVDDVLRLIDDLEAAGYVSAMPVQ